MEDSVVTMVDVAKQQDQEQEEGWLDSSCTFPLNCASQDVFGCNRCTIAGQLAGFCRGCRAICHGDHLEETFEIDGKRDFVCDCGNSKMQNTCRLFPDKPTTNATNKYNHNFLNRFCYCEREYNEDTEDMVQCLVCEDWYHVSCLSLKAPWCSGNNILEDEFDLVCSICIGKHPFIQQFLNAYGSRPSGDTFKFCVAQGLLGHSEPVEKGDYGLFRGWQSYLCRCEECSTAASKEGLSFLFEDDMEEERENPESNVSRLLQDPLVERVFAERYALARELLYEELRPFAESKSVVTEQDMNAILQRLRERISSDTAAF